VGHAFCKNTPTFVPSSDFEVRRRRIDARQPDEVTAVPLRYGSERPRIMDVDRICLSAYR
jgi:hypothetical protein